MRKILSERNVVVILFVVAFVVFYFAQEDAKKLERMYLNTDTGSPSLISTSRQTAGSNVTANKVVKSIGVE